MSAKVLVVPRVAVEPLPRQGTWPLSSQAGSLPYAWLARDRAETDEKFLQIIPYAVLRDAARRLWCYERLGGDERLQRRWSCGVGGHVEATDRGGSVLALAAAALARELAEELNWPLDPARLEPSAWLYEGHSAIGRVHLGLIYMLPWTGDAPPVPAPGEPMAGQGFLPAGTIAGDGRFELWSRLAAAFAAGQ